MHCPRCDTTAAPGARFCRQCGVALPGSGGHAPASDGSTTRSSSEVTPREADSAGAGERQQETAAISTAGVVAAARRTCPSCGSPNSSRREVCGRCGADLETGAALPRPAGPVGPPASDPEPDPLPRRRVLPLVLGVLAVAAVIVVALGLAGLGPFAQRIGMPSAEFDESAYAAEPDGLLLTDIAARTTLEATGDESFDPAQMVDDDPNTAWNNDGGEFEDGVGEVVDLFLDQPAWIDRVVIANGYQADADAYAAHARLERVAIEFDGGERIVANLLDLGRERQAVELPEPRLTTSVRIEVLESFEGDTYPDLAVSDLELEGWTAEGDDRETAVQRADRQRAAGAPVD